MYRLGSNCLTRSYFKKTTLVETLGNDYSRSVRFSCGHFLLEILQRNHRGNNYYCPIGYSARLSVRSTLTGHHVLPATTLGSDHIRPSASLIGFFDCSIKGVYWNIRQMPTYTYNTKKAILRFPSPNPIGRGTPPRPSSANQGARRARREFSSGIPPSPAASVQHVQ